MLTSFALIILLGLALGTAAKLCRLPPLVGMICAGLLLGTLGLLDESVLSVSGDLRRIALVIILTRAGLTLRLDDLKAVGRPALLMCFVPASLEILGIVLLAPRILGVTTAEAALIGAVLAAVSPAVVVPRMIRLIGLNFGAKHRVPQLVLAGASVDDIYVIVLFYAFLTVVSGGSLSASTFLSIPVSIVLGALVGVLAGLLLCRFLCTVQLHEIAALLVVLSVSFLLLQLETALDGMLSGLLAIMTMGITLRARAPETADRLAVQYQSLWYVGEIILFVLVGAAVDLRYALAAGAAAIVLVLGGLIFRMAGVGAATLGTRLTAKERLFCAIAYTPKATVQAAIGGVPLAAGLACGQTVLTVAVLAILITAPLGALGIDLTHRRLLTQEPEKNNPAA